ncbi:MAG: dephospho-CoA kinase, partial [Chloroflexia bacterium]|nr:dephospho-CoA kinase [Chloroflexia bacterium]
MMSRSDVRKGAQRYDAGRPFVIGLTGSVASGKSTVANLLRDHGAAIIDADQVYRSLLAPGSALRQRLVDRFGRAIVGTDNAIDRARLGRIVFQDPE